MLDHGLEFVRATEAAAIAASKWIGTGDKIAADKAATDEMLARLNQIAFAGVVRIGEGKKDESFGLFNGDCVGALASDEFAARYEIAVDPIEGTRPTVTSGPEALSVIAVAEEHSLYSTEEFYRNKIAYGPTIASKVDLQ